MSKQNKFVLNTNINFIQLKLFDFENEEIDPNEIIEKRLNKIPKITNNNPKLLLDENNTFSYVNPICPVCGSYTIIKKGKITKIKQNINGKTTEFNEQQYKCKKCGKRFGIENNPLIKNNKHFLEEITLKIPDIMEIGYQSLRKISKYFQTFLGISVSHQTIKNWAEKNHEEKIENKKFDYSGYYLYDEQFLRLNGVRHYRLTLFDSVLNIPVSEKVVRHRIPENTKKFIQETTKDKPFKCLTTDLFPMYRNVTDDLGVKHQLCVFHLIKTINHKIKTYCRRNKINNKEKERIYQNADELKNCFRQNSSKESIEKFKNYLKNYSSIPEVLRQFIHKYVLNHFKRT